MPRTQTLAAVLVAAAFATACQQQVVTAPEADPSAGGLEPAAADNNPAISLSRNPIEIAVIGDVPYGDAAVARFPDLIESINGDPKVRLAVHVGDTKNGSSTCSDEWFEYIRQSFYEFKDPLVYSPGDNEWTDCHRDNNDNWNPLERLAKIREVYFAKPGLTLGGRRMRVMAQRGYPENQLWAESGVVFAAIHVVGSNNNLSPWTCYAPFDAACPDGNASETAAMAAAREAEWAARDAANRVWLERAFDLARKGAVGVVVFAHGDMWSPGAVAAGADFSGHQAFVELLAARSAAFGGPVLLFAGDSHDYRVDQPLVGDTNYGAPDAPNLTQITVDRSIEDDIAWVKLRVDPRAPGVFAWEEVIVP